MAEPAELAVKDCHDITEVWSGTSAGFDLITNNERQYIAFYDADRNMTVGQRSLDETDWNLVSLPEERKIKWDAHNYVTMVVDKQGYIHLLGNMHVHPLKYFRSTEPFDVTTLERVDEMVGTEEDQVTYPKFLRGPDEKLICKYRDGYSGGGNWIYNIYDHHTKEWSRLLDDPLTYGGDEMNAYPHGPILGPNDYYHLCWVWRNHGGAQTNHDLSYARSKDLREWETSQGDPRDLPLTVNTGDLVDPVPPYGGMINGNTKIGFDSQNRVIISYHKFDSDGNTQVYNARVEKDDWNIYQTSDWNYRWAFGGGGSIPFDIRIGSVEVENGQLVQTYEHTKYGSGKWILDETTLKPVKWISPWNVYPKDLQTVQTEYPDMQVNWGRDNGETDRDTVYALRWESLTPNRDLKREEVPPPTTLRLYEFESQSETD